MLLLIYKMYNRTYLLSTKHAWRSSRKASSCVKSSSQCRLKSNTNPNLYLMAKLWVPLVWVVSLVGILINKRKEEQDVPLPAIAVQLC